MSEKKWDQVAREQVGSEGMPGGGYHITTFKLFRVLMLGDRWRVTVHDDWGSNQGYLQSNGTHDTEGRGDTAEDACEAVRKDVFAWCGDEETRRAEYATALRKLCYTAEDRDD